MHVDIRDKTLPIWLSLYSNSPAEKLEVLKRTKVKCCSFTSPKFKYDRSRQRRKWSWSWVRGKWDKNRNDRSFLHSVPVYIHVTGAADFLSWKNKQKQKQKWPSWHPLVVFIHWTTNQYPPSWIKINISIVVPMQIVRCVLLFNTSKYYKLSMSECRDACYFFLGLSTWIFFLSSIHERRQLNP